MLTENAVETDASQGKEVEEQREVISLPIFFKALKELLPHEEIKEKVRATPAGLFIEQGLRVRILEQYQVWLQRQTQGAVAKSERKCMKRLFGSEQPREYYLVEGKACAVGYLIACPLQQPQNLSLPYYLGSLTETSSYLHPRDPKLSAMESVTVATTSEGAELNIRVKGKTIKAAAPLVAAFQKLAGHSKALSAKYPESQTALRDAARALIKELKRSMVVDKRKHLLVPGRYLRNKRVEFLEAGSLVFAAENGEKLADCYELRAANLNHFIKGEVSHYAGKRHGVRVASIDILPPHARAIGAIRIKGQQYHLAPRCVQDFVERALQSPALRDVLPERFTVVDCLKLLSNICEQSEEIERRKISHYVDQLQIHGARFRTFERWILVVGDNNTLVRCIEKGAGGHERNGGRERPPRQTGRPARNAAQGKKHGRRP